VLTVPLYLCTFVIVGFAAWNIESGFGGEVVMSMVIALAMLPILIDAAQRQGKPWPLWRMYGFVAAFGLGAVVTHYFRPHSVWTGVVLPLSIAGGVMLMRHVIRSRAQ
jgi:hypothetical protein